MVRDHHCATGECLHCGDPDGAHPRVRRLAARDATGSGGRTPLRTGTSDTASTDDPNTTAAMTTAAPGSPTLPSERRSQCM